MHAAVTAAREWLEAAGAGPVTGGLVLGSGLSGLAEELEDRITVPYADIPGFPRATVPGHAGNFVVGKLEGTAVACAQGRFHLYEGWEPAAVALTVRVLHALGARWILVTNAAGSLDPRLAPGSLMAIRDHLNLQFASPLRGRAPEAISNPFPDMSNPYDERLRERLHTVALEERILLRDGVYAGVSGPTYETPAEIRFLRRIGADAIGMSTVGEAIAAAEIGVPLVGISLITNAAAGLSDQPLAHEDVTEIAGRTAERLARLVRGFVRAGSAEIDLSAGSRVP
ncbi:MAG TPA: purine-nucleoside phosphorylase [Gemmatimonadota bacterium]|nr:purine-nucleoside phosphorylase [Gemmatimonadota bacterium]